jgi:hypothetical protein
VSENSGIREFKVVVDLSGKITATQKPEPARRIREFKVKEDTLRARRLVEDVELQLLGEYLHGVLFDNEIGEVLHDAVMDETTSLVRVELEFEERQEKLASWPWEYLYCPEHPGRTGDGYFLATLTRLVLIRHLHLDKPPRPTAVAKEEFPLKILFVASSPSDVEPPVEYQSVLDEIEALQKADEGRIRVFKLVEPLNSDKPPVATFKNLGHQVKMFEPHVIHFVGHGQYASPEGGQIAFMKEDRTADWITAKRFATLLLEAFSVRMVFLQACESAAGDPYHAISGVAQRLAHVNIPAIVAMQYKVKQPYAIEFAREFYKELAAEKPIDVAVQRARGPLSDEKGASSHAFGLPVLYQRQPGGLFAEVAGGEPRKPTPFSGTRVCPWCDSETGPGDVACGKCAGDLSCKCGKPIARPGNYCTGSDRTPLRISCPRCANLNEVRLGFCEKCKSPLMCPHCGKWPGNRRDVCEQCNTSLRQSDADSYVIADKARSVTR